MNTTPRIQHTADTWVVPKVEHNPHWLTPHGTIYEMVSDSDEMTPDEAREYAADLLAAADAVDHRNHHTN